MCLPMSASQSLGPLRERLQVATVVHWPGGRVVWAGHPWPSGKQASLSGEMYTNETLCAFQTNIEDPRRVRGYGWTYTLTVLEDGPAAVRVHVEWQQTAPPLAGVPRRSRPLMLGIGDAVELDRLLPGPVPVGRSCDASSMTLEVRLCGGPVDPCLVAGRTPQPAHQAARVDPAVALREE